MFAASAARAPRVLLLKRWMTTADAAAAAGAAGTAKKTHYDVLGLKHAATAKEVKSQYYKLSLKHHPDRNVGDADATKTFSVIRDAYDTLSDEAKRRQYDHSIGMGVHPNLHHHHHHHPHQQHHWSPKPSTMASSSQHIRYDQHAHYQAHYAGGSDARERKRREQENHEFHKNNKGTHFWHIVVIIAGAVFLAQVVSNQMKEQTAQQLKQK